MNANKTAFPALSKVSTDQLRLGNGLTKREWFAGLILQGLVANPERSGNAKQFVEVALEVADALLKEIEEPHSHMEKREKKEQKSGWSDMGDGKQKDNITGLIWYPAEAEKMNHFQAMEKFKEGIKRLPTIEEFQEAEKHGIRKVFNDLKGRYFWSASLSSFYPDSVARVFGGSSGDDGYVNRVSYYSVRCVVR